MEDIDPPREMPGATESILRTLEAYELHWHGPVVFQSQRFHHYREVAGQLLQDGLAFRCHCSRRQLRARGGIHAGVCAIPQDAHDNDASVRVSVAGPGSSSVVYFADFLQGSQSVDLARSGGDYVILRRDGLPAYHLAVVIDDAEQGVTDVVRGIDLLDSTAVHVHLQHVLRLPTPGYAHLPVVVNSTGQKLSKQTGASPVNLAADVLSATSISVLKLLGLQVPADAIGASPAELWEWAADHWDPLDLRGLRTLPLAGQESTDVP
jgi:glutamyl-Q tRNA(Asp) synthetase